MKIILLIFLLLCSTSYASTQNWNITAPPNNIQDYKGVYNYLNSTYTHFNQLEVVTNNPQPNRQDRFGAEVIYQATGSIYYFCIQTTSPRGSTWAELRLN